MAKKLNIEPVDIEKDDDDSDSIDDASNGPIGSVQSSKMDIEQESDDDEPKGQISSISKDIKPDGSSKITDYHKYLINPQDLQLMQSKKNTAAAIAGIGNSLANQQSAGNFWLHQMNPHQDVSQAANILNNAAEAPIQAKQVLLSQAQKQPQMDLMQQLNQKDSLATRLVNSNAIATLSQIKTKNPEQQASYDDLKKQLASGQMTGYQTKQLFDSDPLLKESFSASIQGQKLDQMMAGLGYRQQKNAEGIFNNDKTLGLYQQRLEGVGRINDLLSSAKQGKIVTNSQVKGMIEEEIARLEQGANNLALGHVERQTMAAAANSWAKVKEYFTGSPKQAITPGQMDQLGGLLGTMTGSYMSQIEDRGSTLSAGMTPQEQSVAQAKMQGIRNWGKKKFGYWGEGDQKGNMIENTANAGAGGPQTKVVPYNGMNYTYEKGEDGKWHLRK